MPPTTHSSRKIRQAFTLVEVLLAMVIIGTGGLVLMTATSRCLAVIRLARNYHTARYVFDRGELEYPVVITNDKVLNLDIGPIEYPNGFTFTRESTERDDLKGMKVVRTRVGWSERGHNSFEETTSYLYYTNSTTP